MFGGEKVLFHIQTGQKKIKNSSSKNKNLTNYVFSMGHLKVVSKSEKTAGRMEGDWGVKQREREAGSECDAEYEQLSSEANDFCLLIHQFHMWPRNNPPQSTVGQRWAPSASSPMSTFHFDASSAAVTLLHHAHCTVEEKEEGEISLSFTADALWFMQSCRRSHSSP